MGNYPDLMYKHSIHGWKLELDVNAMDLDPPHPASCPPIALLPSCSYADDADFWDKSDNGSDFDPSEGNVANFGTFYAPERDQTLRFEGSPSLPASRAPTPEAVILPGYEHYNHPPIVGDYVPFGGRVNDMPEDWRPSKDLTDSEKKKKIDTWDAEQVDYSVDNVEWNTYNAMGFDQGQVLSLSSSQDTDLTNNATALPFTGVCSVVYMALFVMSDAHNKISLHADCPVCNKKEDGVDEPYKWIMDSGASRHFTHDFNDFAEYETEGNFGYVQTAAAHTRLNVKAKGTVKIQVWIDGTWRSNNTPGRYEIFELKEVLYVPGLHQRLLSLGALLPQGLSVFGEDGDLVFYKDFKAVLVASKDLHLSNTIYFVQLFQPDIILNTAEIQARASSRILDHDLWHDRLGHPSRKVLAKAPEHLNGIPTKFSIPKDIAPCKGCAKGKMPERSYAPSPEQVSEPFARIHSDVKEFPTKSYHGFKYYVSFFDDNSSYGWIALLKQKNKAFAKAEQFFHMVKVQFGSVIREWMSDAGGEYKSNKFDQFLKENGVSI